MAVKVIEKLGNTGDEYPVNGESVNERMDVGVVQTGNNEQQKVAKKRKCGALFTMKLRSGQQL